MTMLDTERTAISPFHSCSVSSSYEHHERLRQVISRLARAIADDSARGRLQDVFEQTIREVLPVTAIRLREVPSSYRARLVTPTRTAESVVLDVPTNDPQRQAVLEASFDASSGMDADGAALLDTAAHLGALVLEAARFRLATGRRRLSDAAAPLIGSTAAMAALRDRVERVAATDFTVLVEGESGTGKELVARHLHDLSRRKHGPFVAVNCAALVETLLEAELFGIEERTATGVRGRRGKFEHADGGTLFLDEVSDLSPSAQAKLLRAIQELAVERVGGHGTRRVDVRIVAASNRPLSQLVQQGLFRADLFYRLGGVEIHVPPLRSRRDDILELANYFLVRHRQAQHDLRFSQAAIEALRLYDWPGNVRELERLVERAIALATSATIELDDLPPRVQGDYGEFIAPSIQQAATMRVWAARYAHAMFERCGRNMRGTARVLGISYHTLDAYLRYGAERPGGRRRMPAWVRKREA
jgi:DNA-binding NtrC family response regulator